MKKHLIAFGALVCSAAFVSGLCLAQSGTKKKGEAVKFADQKAVMKEMKVCFQEMTSLDEKLKGRGAATKSRKDLVTKAGRMAELSEAWKPFVKPERAKLADDLVTASNDLAAVAKSAGKKSADIHEAVQGVRAVCGECHKGYKSKEESK